MDKIFYPEDSYDKCFEIEENSFWFQHRNLLVEALLNKYSTNKQIFDIGGGNGFMALYLQNQGFEVTLIEPGRMACENAKKRGVEKIAHGNIDDFNQSIDNAICCDVLEHIQHPQDFLKQLYEKMQPGGVLLLTVPAFQFLWSKADVEAQHFRRYTSALLKRQVSDSGFSVSFASYFFSYLVLPIYLLRTLTKPFQIKTNYSKQHIVSRKKVMQKLILFIFNSFSKFELSFISKGIRIPLGSSLCLVAKKPIGLKVGNFQSTLVKT